MGQIFCSALSSLVVLQVQDQAQEQEQRLKRKAPVVTLDGKWVSDKMVENHLEKVMGKQGLEESHNGVTQQKAYTQRLPFQSVLLYILFWDNLDSR